MYILTSIAHTIFMQLAGCLDEYVMYIHLIKCNNWFSE